MYGKKQMVINGVFSGTTSFATNWEGTERKMYALYTNRSNQIVDIREILGIKEVVTKNGKKKKLFIPAEVRPVRIELTNPNNPTDYRVFDPYYTLYGQPISLFEGI